MKINNKFYRKTWLFVLFLFPFFLVAQNSVTIHLEDAKNRLTVPAGTVRVKTLKVSIAVNDAGFAELNIPAGQYVFHISGAGYKERELIVDVSMERKDTINIILQPDEELLDALTISSTRSNRSFNNTPTRVEVLAAEEINEEASMRPGDIRMMLAESTGIQTQQTSATTGNAAVRIQGLDGRYTQILKDGFPIYSGAASGLGLLQTPPLDLKQVEIIKGSSSTLYGGGAIAGLVNLISKTPGADRELNFLVNTTSAGGFDLNSFYSQRYKRIGVTLYAARNSNKEYDPAGISFSAIPKFARYTLNPKLFIYFNERSKLNFGLNTSVENRIGGDIHLIRKTADSLHSFFERNKTQRFSTALAFDQLINENSSLKFKNSISFYNRRITSKGYEFNGTQLSSFTEATLDLKKKETDLVAGINILTDHFTEPPLTNRPSREYGQHTVGAFIQNTWNTASWFILETGVRADFLNNYGSVILPRASALFKITPRFTSRLGGGLGYKPPTIFTEETERLLYKNVLPISPTINKLERSIGANWDLNYKMTVDEFTLSFNQFFFYTYLRHPLALSPASNNNYQLQNLAGNMHSSGAETNVKIGYDELALYLGYTYTNSKLYQQGISTPTPLTPKHRFNAALVYEGEGKWKIGSELYYFSKQGLTDGRVGRGYWLSGLIAEKIWKTFSLFINFENFADVRQTRFEEIYSGTITNPIFKDIYAPLEGFIVNGGIKLKL